MPHGGEKMTSGDRHRILKASEQAGLFGHTLKDGCPLVLRDTPKGEFSISALLDSDPEVPDERLVITEAVIDALTCVCEMT